MAKYGCLRVLVLLAACGPLQVGPSTLAQLTERVFEHGRLPWLETNNWINPRSEPIIFGLYPGGTWGRRADTWQTGEPNSNPALAPPDGLYQPVNGFGKLWRSELRECFGWAVAPEQPYTGAFQEGGTRQPRAGVGPRGWFAQDLYLRRADGGVVRLVWSSRITSQNWEALP